MTIKTTALILAILSGTALPALAEGRGERQRPDFAQLDTDGDGVVSVAELEAKRAERLAGVDADGDGIVSAEELARAHQIRRAERMIARMDKNGDGLLQLDELQGRGPDPAKLDANGDGVVSEEEFRDGMREMRREGRRGGHRGPRHRG